MGRPDRFDASNEERAIKYWYLLAYLAQCATRDGAIDAFAEVTEPRWIPLDTNIVELHKNFPKYTRRTIDTYFSDLKRRGYVKKSSRADDANIMVSSHALSAYATTLAMWAVQSENLATSLFAILPKTTAAHLRRRIGDIIASHEETQD